MSDETRSAEDAAEESPVDAGAARIAGLEAEIAGLKDQLLRTLADQENLRRRSEREVKDAGTYAITKFARDMLAVSDNLRRALDAVSAEARDAADAALKGIIDGVEMTERDLLAGLDRHGVRKVEPLGEKFDPNFHQAMFEVPNPAAPNGTVIQVIQAGFVIGERVLRPALVGVARNPKPSDPAPEPLDRTV